MADGVQHIVVDIGAWCESAFGGVVFVERNSAFAEYLAVSSDAYAKEFVAVGEVPIYGLQDLLFCYHISFGIVAVNLNSKRM